MSIESISGDFALLDDWEDRYRYVIELGRALAPLAAQDRTEANKVRGCASQVWLATRTSTDPASGKVRLHLSGDSDAHIVRGLVAILLSIYDGKTVEEIAGIDAQGWFDRLGLKEHLTPQRSNGLASMVERIRRDANEAMV